MHILWLVIVYGYLIPILFIWIFIALSYKFTAIDDKGFELFSNKRYYSAFITGSIIPIFNLFQCVSICWCFFEGIIELLCNAFRIFFTVTVKNILKKLFGERT